MALCAGGSRVGSIGWRSVLGALVFAALGACGGGGGGGGRSGSGVFTATIDGQAFASDSQLAMATVAASAPGVYVLTGAKATSSTNYVNLTITLYNLTVPGTYPLGVTGVVFGGIAIVSQSGPSWTTPLSGAAGTVTVSTLTASRIVGTFAFTATAPLDPTSSRTVTNGSFDLPIIGSAGTLPANRGSSMAAQMNGASWTAATVIAGYTAGTLSFSGQTTVGNAIYSVNFIIGSVSGPGTYPLSNPGRTIMVTSGSTQVWSSQLTGATGQVAVTEMTATRAKGSFTATVPPAGTGTTLTITNGSFNVGLP